MHINVRKIQIITENHVNVTQSGGSRQVDDETVTVEEFASEEYATIIDSYEIVAETHNTSNVTQPAGSQQVEGEIVTVEEFAEDCGTMMDNSSNVTQPSGSQQVEGETVTVAEFSEDYSTIMDSFDIHEEITAALDTVAFTTIHYAASFTTIGSNAVRIHRNCCMH